MHTPVLVVPIKAAQLVDASYMQVCVAAMKQQSVCAGTGGGTQSCPFALHIVPAAPISPPKLMHVRGSKPPTHPSPKSSVACAQQTVVVPDGVHVQSARQGRRQLS